MGVRHEPGDSGGGGSEPRSGCSGTGPTSLLPSLFLLEKLGDKTEKIWTTTSPSHLIRSRSLPSHPARQSPEKRRIRRTQARASQKRLLESVRGGDSQNKLGFGNLRRRYWIQGICLGAVQELSEKRQVQSILSSLTAVMSCR